MQDFAAIDFGTANGYAGFRSNRFWNSQWIAFRCAMIHNFHYNN